MHSISSMLQMKKKKNKSGKRKQNNDICKGHLMSGCLYQLTWCQDKIYNFNNLC